MGQKPYFTQRDAAAAYEILASASEDPREVAVLTDEEILALGGVDSTELAGTPFLDESDLDRSAAASIAARSLIARGLVVLDPEREENEGEELSENAAVQPRAVQLDRTLAGLLTLRAAPLGVVNLTRRVADQTTTLLVYLFPEGGVLDELITVDGYHRFSVPTRESAPARLARYIDQDGVAGGEDGESFEGTVADFEQDSPIAQRLRDTRALTVLTSVTGDEAIQLSFMATSDAMFVMDIPQNENDPTVLREISGGTLQELVAEALPVITAQ